MRKVTGEEKRSKRLILIRDCIDKSKCPSDCGFQSKKDIPIIWVPPPQKSLGVLISRDPTFRGIPFYNYYMSEEKEFAKKMLFAHSIPKLLIERILEFMGDRISKNNIKNLFDTIFQQVYWTHLHKCITDRKKEPFKKSNAFKCANKWLLEELSLIYSSKDEFVITLGNEARDFVDKKLEKSVKEKFIFVNLPHPSGVNRKWNDKNNKDIIREINALLDICKKVKREK